MSAGFVILQMLKEQNKSSLWLGEKLKMSKEELNKALHGELSIILLTQICKALGVTLNDVYKRRLNG